MVLISEKRNPTDPFSFSNALIGRPHQLQKPCFTALSPRAIFMLSFIHKTNAVSSFFNNCHAKKLACLYEPQFGRISLHWRWNTFWFFIKTKKLQGEVLNSTCRTISVYGLLHVINLVGHFWKLLIKRIIWLIKKDQWSYSTDQIILSVALKK